MFWRRFALALGRHDVENLRNELTTQEQFAWELYFRCEPFGFPGLARAVGEVCATMLNQKRTQANQKLWRPRDFFPPYQPYVANPPEIDE